MNLQEAFNILDSVASSFKGTRQDHALLKQALDLIGKTLFSPHVVAEVQEPNNNNTN